MDNSRYGLCLLGKLRKAKQSLILLALITVDTIFQGRKQQGAIGNRYFRSRDISLVSTGLNERSIVRGTHGKYEGSCFTIQTKNEEKILLGVPRYGNGLDRDEWVSIFRWLAMQHNKELQVLGMPDAGPNGLGHNPAFESYSQGNSPVAR